MVNIAVFASGNGSNFQAIADAIKRKRLKARIALLECDNPGAYVLKRARREKVDTLLIERGNYTGKDAYENAILIQLKKHDVKFIALAGYMRMVGYRLLKAYKNRIVNIHPALLPSFKGADGIGDAMRCGVKVTGVTIHFVNEFMDAGAIIMQAAIEIREGDTKEALAKRVHAVEHIVYPKALVHLVEGRIKISGRRVKLLSKRFKG